MERRQLLTLLGLAPIAHLTARVAQAEPAGSAEKQPTPAQTAGPFHPVRDQDDKDLDLTRVKGRAGRAQGQVIRIKGTVRDQHGQPVPKAQVEIWQANKNGRYAHERDTNPAPLDPDFQGWGITETDAQGGYRFLSIKPGSYPAAQGWERPPHIHFKVTLLGHHELTTQLYFAGEKLNDKDAILLDTPEARRPALIVAFAPVEDAAEGKILEGEFNMVLRKAGPAPAPATPK